MSQPLLSIIVPAYNEQEVIETTHVRLSNAVAAIGTYEIIYVNDGSRDATADKLAAIAAGADGLIIEVHNNPAHALCDGAQSLTPPQFAQLVGKITAMAPIVERTM